MMRCSWALSLSLLALSATECASFCIPGHALTPSWLPVNSLHLRTNGGAASRAQQQRALTLRAAKSKAKKKNSAPAAKGFGFKKADQVQAELTDAASDEYHAKYGQEAQEKASEEHMARVEEAVKRISAEILPSLTEKGYFMVDNFLGDHAASQMRREADGLQRGGLMGAGESTRWNPETGKVEKYIKDNVFTMQVQGGKQYYLAPRLVEYIVKITEHLSKTINSACGKTVLKETVQTNKLAVCTGDGSNYAKHYDNMGGEDRRKLTALYYMNPKWKKENGGCFRAFDPMNPEKYDDIEPLYDRFLCFWSDDLVHSVQPSYAKSESEHRFALTVWFYADDDVSISRNDEVEKIHFPETQDAVSLAG